MPLDRKSQSSSFVALPPSLPFDDPNYFVVNPLAPSVMAPVSYGSQAALDVSSDLALSPGLVDHYCSPSASEVHEHSSSCGHEPVRHDDHIDYVVDGQLHHLHGNHCDWHGMLSPATDPDALPSSSDMAGEMSLVALSTSSPMASSLASTSPLTASSANSTTASLRQNYGLPIRPHDWCECQLEDESLALCNDQKNCLACNKRRLRKVVPRLPNTNEDYEQEYARFVKPKYVKDFAVKAPLVVLKCVTVEMATQIMNACRSLALKCDTIRDLARLSEAHVNAIKGTSPSLLRSLPAAREAAQFLVNVEMAASRYQQRLKNSACCARFRKKKKEKLGQLQHNVRILNQSCDDLTERMLSLERERRDLYNLAINKGLVPSVGPLQPLDLSKYDLTDDMAEALAEANSADIDD